MNKTPTIFLKKNQINWQLVCILISDVPKILLQELLEAERERVRSEYEAEMAEMREK